MDGPQIVWCDSGNGKVYQDDNIIMSFDGGGYPRGFYRDDDLELVGVSSHRHQNQNGLANILVKFNDRAAMYPLESPEIYQILRVE